MENTESKKYLPKLAMWTFLWLITMALSSFGPELIWDKNIAITVAVVIINFSVGLMMIWINIKYWKSLDEMMQRIQLDAMGLALGIGVVGGLSYSTLVANEVIFLRSEVSVMVVIMALTYITATVVGVRRMG